MFTRKSFVKLFLFNFIREFHLLLIYDHFTNNYQIFFFYKEILCKIVPINFIKQFVIEITLFRGNSPINCTKLPRAIYKGEFPINSVISNKFFFTNIFKNPWGPSSTIYLSLKSFGVLSSVLWKFGTIHL